MGRVGHSFCSTWIFTGELPCTLPPLPLRISLSETLKGTPTLLSAIDPLMPINFLLSHNSDAKYHEFGIIYLPKGYYR